MARRVLDAAIQGLDDRGDERATMQFISRLSVMMRDERENRRDISGGGRRPRRLGS